MVEKNKWSWSGTIQKQQEFLNYFGVWMLWKHQNRCVFDGIAQNMAMAVTQAEEERKVWELAGAKGTSSLMEQLPGVL
jgi:hypothetical protein